jgi:hypothetical protein
MWCVSQNEPFSTTWGTGNSATDWNTAAARIANAIATSVSNRFLIFVEGTATSPTCTDACFYGENLMVFASHTPVAHNRTHTHSRTRRTMTNTTHTTHRG